MFVKRNAGRGVRCREDNRTYARVTKDNGLRSRKRARKRKRTPRANAQRLRRRYGRNDYSYVVRA